MKFDKIVCVDYTKLKDWALEELQGYSEAKVENYTTYPENEEEVISRIGDAEIVFVSWRTPISESIIKNCPNLKYIGMCCSLYDDESANVAVTYARSRGIVVKGIRDYGDPGVVEFIVSELVRLLHGFGEHQWKEMPLELTRRKLGIIGLGTTGQLLASCLLPFGVDLYYYSRTRKKDWENKGVRYLELEELLQTSEIVSLHLPKNVVIFGKNEFEHFGNGKILVNTSLGLPVEEKAFNSWIKDQSNFAIFDGDARYELSQSIIKLPGMITANKSAGWSLETHDRLNRKVMDNFNDYLAQRNHT